MRRRLTPVALLSVSLVALAAPVSAIDAESECVRPAYVWDL